MLNTAKFKPKMKKLYNQNLTFLQQNMPQEDATHDINDISKDFSAAVECSIFEDIRANQYFMHKIEKNFICTHLSGI